MENIEKPLIHFASPRPRKPLNCLKKLSPSPKTIEVFGKPGVIRSIYNAAYLALVCNAQTGGQCGRRHLDRLRRVSGKGDFHRPAHGASDRYASRTFCYLNPDDDRQQWPRNALLPPTLPSTPLPPMLVVVVMGVTYAEGIKCCSELESLASLTTTIITTTFTY